MKTVFHDGKWITAWEYWEFLESDPIEAALYKLWEQDWVDQVDAIYGTKKEKEAK